MNSINFCLLLSFKVLMEVRVRVWHWCSRAIFLNCEFRNWELVIWKWAESRDLGIGGWEFRIGSWELGVGS